MKSFCPQCGTETDHKESFQEKQDHYPNTFWGGVWKFIWETLVVGGSTNMTLKKLDEMDRVVTCLTCNHSRIENQGDEFQ